MAAFLRRQGLSPELLVRNPVDQGTAGAAAKMPKQALAGIDVARVDERDAALARKR